jgi:hypothetical protein
MINGKKEKKIIDQIITKRETEMMNSHQTIMIEINMDMDVEEDEDLQEVINHIRDTLIEIIVMAVVHVAIVKTTGRQSHIMIGVVMEDMTEEVHHHNIIIEVDMEVEEEEVDTNNLINNHMEEEILVMDSKVGGITTIKIYKEDSIEEVICHLPSNNLLMVVVIITLHLQDKEEDSSKAKIMEGLMMKGIGKYSSVVFQKT